MKKITFPECPSCGAESECVGRWDSGEANEGEWYCFECQSHGTFQVSFTEVKQEQE